MPSKGSVSRWMDQVKEGDEDAAQKLWERYFEQLVGLARNQLRGLPKGMADEEDVVLKTFDSFYRGAKTGRYPDLGDRNNLWRLLIAMTANKARDLARHERRQKRGGGKVINEAALAGKDESRPSPLLDVISQDPTPEFAAELAEDVERRLDALNDEELRKIALWKMEGYRNEEIAEMINRVPRTVERKLELIRRLWTDENSPPSIDD